MTSATELMALEPLSHRVELVIDLMDDEELVCLEAYVGTRSESGFWEGLDGEIGVFLATYQELPIGTDVRLTLHTTTSTFVCSATVAWVRELDAEHWPGLGLELSFVSPELADYVRRFSRWRPSLFYC